MAFSFFNPWLWLAALALAVPLWLHLRRRREKNVLYFSALRFLQDTTPRARRPMKLEDAFLLALRVLALVLLAAGFAWPYIRSEKTAAPAESRVYIFDNTLSVQAEGGYERGQKSLVDRLRRAPENTQTAVIELRANPAVIVPLTASRDVASGTVQALSPTHQRGSYSAAFRTAASLLASSPALRKTVVFIGDNQINQWAEAAGLSPSLYGISVEIPASTYSNLPNTCISAERIGRLHMGDKSRVSLTLRLARSGAPAKGTLTVRSGSNVVFEQNVALGPEPRILNCEWDDDPTQPVLGEATIESVPDALAADDRVYFALAPLSERKVALLAGSVYMKVGLSRTVMRGHWSTEFLDSTHLPERPTADVLCLESEFLPAASKLAQAYLASGRGILLFVNRLSPAVKGALLELGFQSEETLPAANAEGDSMQVVGAQNPIFGPLQDADFGGVSEIKVFSYAHLSSKTATPLACSQSGTPLLFESDGSSQAAGRTAEATAVIGPETKPSRGKLLLVAFGMERTQTLWPLHPSFVPFLDLCLQATASKNVSTAQSYQPGETATLKLGPAKAERFMVTRIQSNIPPLTGRVKNQQAQFTVPDQPGLYQISLDPARPETPTQFFAINPSIKESDLTYTNGKPIIREWQEKRPNPNGAEPTTSTPVQLASIFNQRIWWWLLTAGVVALLIETIVADRPVRKIS